MSTHEATASAPSVALISLEPWDEVWRRNQHFAHQLVQRGHAARLLFVEPPVLGQPERTFTAEDRLQVLRPALRVPKRFGGLALTGHLLRRGVLATADVLWVNDPTLGVHCLRAGQPAVYDVTDDWREFAFPVRIVRRLRRAEDLLARTARTTVCSQVLADRWRERYGVTPVVVPNGVDAARWRAIDPNAYDGPAPHVGYVGTLQDDRLDVDLVLRLAESAAVGTVDLVGPDALSDPSRRRLRGHPKVRLHGPVPVEQVPAWTMGLDVLISPHKVTPFTLSLDAIKSYEYAASGRPVVATPTSGFQLLAGRAGWTIAQPESFVEAVAAACGQPVPIVQPDDLEELDWSHRADAFAAELRAASSRAAR